jgi:hypothetical protein
MSVSKSVISVERSGFRGETGGTHELKSDSDYNQIEDEKHNR